jgi:hypothetical protein
MKFKWKIRSIFNNFSTEGGKHYENQFRSPLLNIEGLPTIPRAWQEAFNNTKSIAKKKKKALWFERS